MSTFLLEIGTEELPADFARLALPQLEQLVFRDFQRRRLSFGKITCTSTPRRIVLLVSDLSSKASDSEEEKKGPPATQAFSNGSPTQAALGFAKRFDLKIDELEVRNTSKGPFVFAKVTERGESANELLAQLIPSWIGSLQGRRFMRWGKSERRFSRPVRWLVALLDKELIPVNITDSDPVVSSGNVSRGHRLHSSDVVINSAEEYINTLFKVGVNVDRNSRTSLIESLIKDASELLKARADLSNDLLEELTDIVESPSLIKGDFDESFLNLPPEVLSTVMRVHQRYVPLYRIDSVIDPLAIHARNTLFPSFLCICNSLEAAKKNVKIGNQRVLTARLSDAEFFVKSDLATSSVERRENLSRVTFAEGLGSLLQRVERIEWLTKSLVNMLKVKAPISDFVQRASHLCKHDLVSQMVGEFPELQGIMGGKYLLSEGEPLEVALAVYEHYLPKGSGDQLPESHSGSILAIADRIELLLSIFAKGERPTGSSDPFALRRACNGILQIVWLKKWNLNLYDLLIKATNHWREIFPELGIESLKLRDELSDFIRQRIINLIEESGIDNDLVQAVSGESVAIRRLLSDPLDVKLRANLLANMRHSGELMAVQTVVTRASKLAEKGELPLDILSPSEVVDIELFESPSEKEMLQVLISLEPFAKEGSINCYKKLAEGLTSSAETLENFFDGDNSVLVMVDDLSVRRNRINLLCVLRNQASVLADFNKITG